ADMSRVLDNALLGLAAGAAGTTALDAATYLDMAIRGRPSSSTPEDSVKRISAATGVRVPGEGGKQGNRVAGIGPLLGILAGVTTGAAVGAARGAGLVSGRVTTGAAATLGAMVAGNLPMTIAGVTDPRTWSA